MKFTVIIIGILFSTKSFCQGDLLPLLRGDDLPDIEVFIYKNKKTEKMSLKGLKGKVILFEFWNVKCGTCISWMTDHYALQQKMKDSVQIVYITKNSSNEIEEKFRLIKKDLPTAADSIINAGRNLTFITSDKIMHQLFPNNEWGVQVWIDKNLKFRYFVEPGRINTAKLRQFINGYSVDLIDRDEKKLKIIQEDPLTWINQIPENLKYYSFIFSHIPKRMISRRIFIKDPVDNGIAGINVVNASILDLYRHAYQEGNTAIKLDEVFLEVVDKGKYYNIKNVEGSFSKNQYCYALSCPSQDSASVLRRMIFDLDNYFNIQSGWQERMVKCYKLVRISDQKMFIPDSVTKRQTKDFFINTNQRMIHVQSQNIVSLLNLIEYHFKKEDKFVTLVNETGYDGLVDVVIPISYNKHDSPVSDKDIQDSLNKYGLGLIEGFVKRNVLLIKEK